MIGKLTNVNFTVVSVLVGHIIQGQTLYFGMNRSQVGQHMSVLERYTMQGKTFILRNEPQKSNQGTSVLRGHKIKSSTRISPCPRQMKEVRTNKENFFYCTYEQYHRLVPFHWNIPLSLHCCLQSVLLFSKNARFLLQSSSRLQYQRWHLTCWHFAFSYKNMTCPFPLIFLVQFHIHSAAHISLKNKAVVSLRFLYSSSSFITVPYD